MRRNSLQNAARSRRQLGAEFDAARNDRDLAGLASTGPTGLQLEAPFSVGDQQFAIRIIEHPVIDRVAR